MTTTETAESETTTSDHITVRLTQAQADALNHAARAMLAGPLDGTGDDAGLSVKALVGAVKQLGCPLETYEIEAKNRQDLTGSLDIGLLMNGRRISAGVYEVTVTRVRKRGA